MDSKNLEEIKKLTAFCRKNGIQSLKVGDIALEFSPGALFPESTYKKKQLEEKEIQVESLYTEEQILNWSSEAPQ